MILHGDCLAIMPTLEPESVDAVVTDPPYNLNFMGKAWDKNLNHGPWAVEALCVTKPGGYLLAFGGTRTFHRLAVAIEDAGWIIRDTLVWGYASGFPKGRANLKPAWEPIVMARKPGPLRHLAIDECRIPLVGDDYIVGGDKSSNRDTDAARIGAGGYDGTYTVRRGRGGEASAERRYADKGGTNIAAKPGPRGGDAAGRWPANIILTDPIFDGGIEGVVGGGEQVSPASYKRGPREFEHSAYELPVPEYVNAYGDSGTYSRFFLIPKADRADREPVLRGQVEAVRSGGMQATLDGSMLTGSGNERTTTRENSHPTVKPTELMRHLVRLVTPVGGTVLDPFLGSGTTAIAAEMEGFAWIGIEKEAEYVAIAEARLNGTQRGLGLDVPAPTRKRTGNGGGYTQGQPAAKSSWFHGRGGMTDEDVA